MSKIRGVILDVDGTLVDSNDAHAQAWVQAFAEHGHSVPFEKVKRMIGMGSDKLMPAAIGISKDSEEGQQLARRREEIFKEQYIPHLQAFPKAKELLQRMREDGLQLVVASSAKEEELKTLLRIVGASDLIKAKTSSDQVKRSKPDPDAVETALDQIGLPAEQVVMLGDTPYDMEAAQKAGVGFIGVRCGGWGDQDLQNALAVYADPAEFLERYGESVIGIRNA